MVRTRTRRACWVWDGGGGDRGAGVVWLGSREMSDGEAEPYEQRVMCRVDCQAHSISGNQPGAAGPAIFSIHLSHFLFYTTHNLDQSLDNTGNTFLHLSWSCLCRWLPHTMGSSFTHSFIDPTHHPLSARPTLSQSSHHRQPCVRLPQQYSEIPRLRSADDAAITICNPSIHGPPHQPIA